MYITYYNAIKTHFKEHLNQIKTIDWFNHNYDGFDEKKYDPLPAIYIEFEDDIDWRDGGNGLQHADTYFRVHIVCKDLKDIPDKIMNLSQDVHLKTQNIRLYLEDQQLTSELTRTGSKFKSDYDQVKVMVLKYKAMFYDYSTMPDTSKIITSFKIDKA